MNLAFAGILNLICLVTVSRSKMMILLLFIPYSILAILAYMILLANNKRNKAKTLLVIAHPDDETMFFAPTLNLSDQLYILCLSNGLFKVLTSYKTCISYCVLYGKKAMPMDWDRCAKRNC